MSQCSPNAFLQYTYRWSSTRCNTSCRLSRKITLVHEAKEKYRGVFEIQKSRDKTSSGEIGSGEIKITHFNNILYGLPRYLMLYYNLQLGLHHIRTRLYSLPLNKLHDLYESTLTLHFADAASPEHRLQREKGRYLTQSYDKSPYTNRYVIRAKLQHKQRHKKVRLHSSCGPT